MLTTRCPDCDRALLATDNGKRACVACGQIFDGRNVLDRDYWAVRTAFTKPPPQPVPMRRRNIVPPITPAMFDDGPV